MYIEVNINISTQTYRNPSQTNHARSYPVQVISKPNARQNKNRSNPKTKMIGINKTANIPSHISMSYPNKSTAKKART
jgi:hypothetical protein